MKTPPIRSLLLLTALLAAWACSVREDRRPCPCYLTIVLDRAGAQLHGLGMDSLRVAAAGDGPMLQDASVATERCPDDLEWQVPKQWVRIAAHAGAKRLQQSRDALLIAYGTEADSLFAYSARVDCNGEAAADTVRLHKQFATLSLVVTGPSEAHPFILELESRWAGWDRMDFSPVMGRFRATATQVDNEQYRIRLPRQGDDGLELHAAGWNGEPLKSLPIGKEIAARGYDWFAPDLADIRITIDFARATVDVTISDWDNGGSQQYDI